MSPESGRERETNGDGPPPNGTGAREPRRDETGEGRPRLGRGWESRGSAKRRRRSETSASPCASHPRKTEKLSEPRRRPTERDRDFRPKPRPRRVTPPFHPYHRIAASRRYTPQRHTVQNVGARLFEVFSMTFMDFFLNLFIYLFFFWGRGL